MVTDRHYIGCYYCGQTYIRPGAPMAPDLDELGLYRALDVRYKTNPQLRLVQMGEKQSCLPLT